jgi:uridine kinase
MQPVLIGIAGPSGAGKSELANALRRRFSEPVSVLSLDSYYRPLTHMPFEERTQYNFDHPDALEWPLIVDDVQRIARGEAVEEPVYLFERHDRAEETRRVEPAPYVLLEGLFALYHEPVRELLSARIFVEAPDEVCLQRRIARDTVERGRTREGVIQQYRRTVRPMALEYVLPTQEFADLVVSGESPIVQTVEAVCQLLAPRRCACAG